MFIKTKKPESAAEETAGTAEALAIVTIRNSQEAELMWEKEDIIKELKNRGKRITQQRETMIDVITTEQCGNVKELYYKVAKVDPGIGLATVYRMLMTLEEIGAIERTKGYVVTSQEQTRQKAIAV